MRNITNDNLSFSYEIRHLCTIRYFLLKFLSVTRVPSLTFSRKVHLMGNMYAFGGIYGNMYTFGGIYVQYQSQIKTPIHNILLHLSVLGTCIESVTHQIDHHLFLFTQISYLLWLASMTLSVKKFCFILTDHQLVDRLIIIYLWCLCIVR